jgi:hypothetical protein
MEAILSNKIVNSAAKKRNRDSLSSNTYSSRFEADSQSRNYFRCSRGIAVSAQKSVRNHFRAKAAVEESRIADTNFQ